MRRLALLAVLAPLGVAEAHQFTHPKTVRLGLTPDRVLVSITFDQNPGDAAREMRQLADRDGDGTLDGEEVARLQRFLVGTATHRLSISANGAKLPLVVTAVEGNKLDLPASSTQTLGVSILATATLPGDPRVRLELADVPPSTAPDTPVIVDRGSGWDVELCAPGEWIEALRQFTGIHLTVDRKLVLGLRRLN